jgi:hypothetical protein
LKHGLVDDKTMVMERTIQLVANLPHGSKARRELTNGFLNELWYSLDHPPMLYVGDQYKYRSADGSMNVSSDLQFDKFLELRIQLVPQNPNSG